MPGGPGHRVARSRRFVPADGPASSAARPRHPGAGPSPPSTHARGLLAADVNLEDLARVTPGFSGADLENLVNEAALAAARRESRQVSRQDFENALDKLLLGGKREALMDERERRTVAYHEGGHALVAAVLPDVDPLYKVTIVPRGRSLGVTQFQPEDDRRNLPRTYLIERLAVALGGRSSEELALGDIITGAQNDLKEA
ncbi:MAG: hypothetical protein E6I80_30120, partial [Chloroflexi bacterium]